MSDPNTITIPAHLWGIFASVRGIRAYAEAVECDGHLAGAKLLRHLADEYEQQGPRPVGWYHVKDDFLERVLWWNGEGWLVGPGFKVGTAVAADATITPVTIGDPS